MKIQCWSLVAFLLMCVCFQESLVGQESETPEHDARVKTLLDETDLKYEIDKDGDFKLLFEYDDGRSHIVFVNSGTESYQGMEIREVWAVGYVPPEDGDKVESKICENLIRANATSKIGAWQVQKMGDKEVAVFRAMIPAASDQQTLTDTLKLVGISADEKESELLKSDDL